MKFPLTLGTLVTIVTAGPYDTGHPVNVDCQPGFTLVGKKCEQNTFQAAQITCSLGQLQGNKCITVAQPITACPIGAQQDGNQCKILHYDTPTAECPNGYFLENGTCINRTPLPLTEVCDMGKPDGRGGCLLTERVTKVTKKTCPAGFHDEGKGCAKVTTYDCSPGEVPKKKPIFPTAAPMSKGQPIASPYFSSYKKHKRMLGSRKNYAPISIASIPAAQSKGAPIPVKTAPVAALPASQVAVVKQLCQREDYAPYVVEHFCPQGYADDGAGCISTQTYPMSQRCINGASAESCFEPKLASPNMKCARGALVADKCVIAEQIAIETVCPAGTERVGGVCHQYTSPSVTCPPGTTLEGQNCVGKIYTEPTGVVTHTCHGKECWH